MNRKEFLKRAAGIVAGVAVLPRVVEHPHGLRVVADGGDEAFVTTHPITWMEPDVLRYRWYSSMDTYESPRQRARMHNLTLP